jgi:hypothetical protein
MQRQILNSHTIPNKFKPSTHLVIAEPYKEHLQNEFDNIYETAFFAHLAEVIKSNQLALEIEKAKLTATTTTTSNITQMDQPIPQSEPYHIQKTPKKRKRSTHPTATKKTKQSFLELRQTPPKGIT